MRRRNRDMIENTLLDRLVNAVHIYREMYHDPFQTGWGNATLCGGTSKTLRILHGLVYCSVDGAVWDGGGYDGDAIEMNFSRPSSSDCASARQKSSISLTTHPRIFFRIFSSTF